MTTPRTIAGQAALSALRPHLKRALGTMIVSIESQAARPYVEALREVDALLADLAALDADAAWERRDRRDLVERATVARQRLGSLLE